MRKQKVYIINLLHGWNYRNFIIWHDMQRCRNIWRFLFAIWLPKCFSPYLFIKNVSVLYLVCVINAMCFRPTLLMGTESKNSFFSKKNWTNMYGHPVKNPVSFQSTVHISEIAQISKPIVSPVEKHVLHFGCTYCVFSLGCLWTSIFLLR